MVWPQKQKTIETYQKKAVVDSFDKGRNKYAFQKYKHKTEADFLKNTLKSIKKDKIKILDVGCGTGRMLPEIFSIGKEIEYFGLDTSKEMVKHLKEKAKKLSLGKEVKVKIGDASKLPFNNGTFDVVFTYHLLWHIPKENQREVIKEMERVTKKGGFIVFDVLNKDFIWEKIKIILSKKKEEGLYKIRINEAKKMINNSRNIKIGKLNDAPIKKDFFYNVFNLINKTSTIFPQRFYHMLYLRIGK